MDQQVPAVRGGCVQFIFQCRVLSAAHEVRRILREGPLPCSFDEAQNSRVHQLATSCVCFSTHVGVSCTLLWEPLVLWESAKRLVGGSSPSCGATEENDNDRKIEAAFLMSCAIRALTHIATTQRTQEDSLSNLNCCNELQAACGEILGGGESVVWSAATLLSRLIQEITASVLLQEIPSLMYQASTSQKVEMMYLLSSSSTKFQCRPDELSDHEPVEQCAVCVNKRCRALLRRNSTPSVLSVSNRQYHGETCFNCATHNVFALENLSSIENFETWGNFTFALTGQDWLG